MQSLKPISTRETIVMSFGILVLIALILLAMGRVPICTCGYIKLWAGDVTSNENSQMLFDWYTFSHIIHGFIFYFLLKKFAKKLPPQYRFLIAFLLEAGWEILENSPIIINRYRATTISFDYYGDSVINSIFDVIAMTFGYIAAVKLPTWIIIILILIMEIGVAYMIRDNLTLNIVILFFPFPRILEWQQGI